ncbi:MFS transporter [Polyangium aurulentum]|nr:MFS transporter [Polyangium aurulentum]
MAALEGTVVATAMPTVAHELKGLLSYAWVTNAYLLTSAVAVPIYGKLSDMYGRKPIFLFGVLLFLLGSAASGAAQSMTALIVFRALQGLGAGAMQPVALTIIGDIFDLEERSRMQGLFGSVWGIFGIVGPILGGIIVKYVSWRWVFFINIPFGLACAALVGVALHENIDKRRRRLDIAGAALLATGVTALLISTSHLGTAVTATSTLLALVLIGLFVWVELRAAEPVLPFDLFARPIMAHASLMGALLGGAMMGSLTFVPLFIQGVLRGSPTEAGGALTPMLVAWPIASAIGGRLIPKVGIRPLVRVGISLTAVGSLLLMFFGHRGIYAIYLATGFFGLGMGLGNTALVIAVQTSVEWAQRGIATASTMFFRTIGGLVAVGVMGGLLAASFAADPNIPPDAADLVLSREGMTHLSPELLARIGHILEEGVRRCFFVTGVLGALAFIAVLFFPDVSKKPATEPVTSAPPAH